MINESDSRTFQQIATQGPVIDKDATMDALGQVRSLYRIFGMTGKQSRAVMEPHEQRLLGGIVEEQLQSAQVIFDARSNLQTANASLQRARAQRDAR